jgi:hypothetical protein
MLKRLALGAAFVVTVSFTGAALAQAPGAGSPAGGQGLSGPPGSQTPGDVAKPPSASREILQRSFVPAPAATDTARGSEPPKTAEVTLTDPGRHAASDATSR